MKRFLSLLIVGLLCLSTLFTLKQQVKADSETIIFQDDFETYTVGSFPSAAGWELVWNGKGTQYQIVTDTVSNSPTKSLQLWGRPSWSANVQREFTSSSEMLSYEVYIRTDSNTGMYHNIASVCFWNLSGLAWGKRFADTWFGQDGEIYTRPVSGSPFVPLGLTYEAHRWYKVRVVVDRTAETYNVWIDDILVAQDIGIWDTDEIEALMLQSGHAEVKAYFDDVKVFEGIINQPPVAEFECRASKTSFTRSKLYVKSPIVFDAEASYDPDGPDQDPITYIWDFGDGSDLLTTTDPVAAHTYLVSGYHIVTLTVADEQGASDQISKQIRIDPFEYELWVEIDYVTGHKPNDNAMEYVEVYFRSNGIDLVIDVDDEVGDPTPDDLMITLEDFWVIENSWNEANLADDVAFGDENVAKTKLTLKEKWVLWGTVWGEQLGQYGVVRHTVCDLLSGDWYGGNYVFIADTLVGWYAQDHPKRATKAEVEAMLLMHELGHCIGIYKGTANNEDYAENRRSVMHGVRRRLDDRTIDYLFNKKLDEKYSREYWKIKNLGYYEI